LFDAECREEQMICAAAAEGVRLCRRGDASPAAVFSVPAATAAA
jgi:hypothetical protein